MTWKAWWAASLAGTLVAVSLVGPPRVDRPSGQATPDPARPAREASAPTSASALHRSRPKRAAWPMPVAAPEPAPREGLLDVLDERGEGLLRGDVVDTEGFPVDAWLNVDCPRGRFKPAVDISGSFRVPAPQGPCAVTAHRRGGSGGRSETVEVQVRAGAETELRLVMPPDPGGDLGLVAELHEYGFEVRTVVPGSPADLAGLRSGDIVVEVDGLQAVDLDAVRFAELVSGPVHSDVRLVVGFEASGEWVEEPVALSRALVSAR